MVKNLMGLLVAVAALSFAPMSAWANCTTNCYGGCYDTWGEELGTPAGNLGYERCLDVCNSKCMEDMVGL